jgi:hypothetical protein
MTTTEKLIALYWYCVDYTCGQNSWQYKYISQNPHYNPGPLRTKAKDFEENPEVKNYYRKLEDHYEWKGGFRACADAIAQIQSTCKTLGIFEEEPVVDIRIQCLDYQFHVYWGDPQYDPNHSGQWTYGDLAEDSDPEELATELLRQQIW